MHRVARGDCSGNTINSLTALTTNEKNLPCEIDTREPVHINILYPRGETKKGNRTVSRHAHAIAFALCNACDANVHDEAND